MIAHRALLQAPLKNCKCNILRFMLLPDAVKVGEKLVKPMGYYFLLAWKTVGSSSSSCTWAAAQMGMCAPLMKLAASEARNRIGPARH